ncbi:MAG: PASTA domain-containing protein [Prevotellaceae bacterium]|jgi:cell division protein FtsI/penicillin-binding protein 2|nr:PASTA domain-containing protein [Prevotellaceae bacterium]
MKKVNKIYKCTIWVYRFFVGFAIWCVGFAIVNLFNTDLKEAEKKARERIINSESFRRGSILSSDEKPLAAYYPEYMVFADFGVRINANYTIDKNKVSVGRKTKNKIKLDTFRINIYKEFAKSLVKAVGGNADNHYKELYNYRLKAENARQTNKTSDKKWYTENILKHKINIFQRDEIIENPHLKKRGRNITGIYTSEIGKRTYPFGENFAHSTIGVFVDNNISGIEKVYDNDLKNGNNIITTIDTRMQDICETVLRNEISGDKRLVGGTIVLMEVATGDIKAMANLGSYNKKEYGDVYDMYNNATRATIEPGSTFKTVSMMLALETGKISIADKFNSKVWRGKVEKNKLDTFLTVSRIIEHSSNTGTANMVDKAFDNDVEKFVQAIKDLKITDRIGNLDEIQPSINRERVTGSMLNISHGYQVNMAPVHILSFYNAIANNGVMVRPRLVNGFIRHGTGVKKMFAPEIINKSICSKSTLEAVRTVLSRVVGRGSAWQIAGSPYGIAGKTGTAKIYLGNKGYETNDGLSRELSSFCGYFPQKNPKYSCIVVLYTRFLNKTEMDNFYASSTAVPLFRKVSDKIYALYINKDFIPSDEPVNIPIVKSGRGKNLLIISEKLDLPVPVENSDTWIKVDTINNKLRLSELSIKKGIVPNVIGMGLRDAIFLLENRGLRVSYSGIGTIVKQSPEQGITYNPGQRIYLTLKTN